MIVFEPGQTILFIGDSITDADRRGPFPPFGNGYVSMVRNFLLARYPELNLRIVNRGVGGDTTREMAARWQVDVINEQPDWLSVGIGINDVWRAYGDNPEEAVPLPEYEATLRRLLDQARRQTRARFIIIEPYMIEPDQSQPMRQQMDLYRSVLPRLAADYNALLVPAQDAFDRVLLYTRPDDWSDDQIHPNGPGHAVIALTFLRTVGFEL